MVLKMEMTDLISEQLTTLSKYDGLGSAMAAELIIDFWFGIRLFLAVKMMESLDYCIEELINKKIRLFVIKWQNNK